MVAMKLPHICTRQTALQTLNESLQRVGELPVRLRKIHETKYTTTVGVKFESAVRKNIF
jgi:hypothetical protein